MACFGGNELGRRGTWDRTSLRRDCCAEGEQAAICRPTLILMPTWEAGEKRKASNVCSVRREIK